MSAKTGECHCERCQKLCTHRPGAFAPGEATIAAKELGLTLREFFDRYLTVNYWSDTTEAGYGDVDHLTPAWRPRQDVRSAIHMMFAPGAEERMALRGPMNGRRCSFAEGFSSGPCMLLGPKGCMLSFAARPLECREAYGCESVGMSDAQAHSHSMALHRKAIDPWKTNNAELAAVEAEEP